MNTFDSFVCSIMHSGQRSLKFIDKQASCTKEYWQCTRCRPSRRWIAVKNASSAKLTNDLPSRDRRWIENGKLPTSYCNYPDFGDLARNDFSFESDI